MIRPCLLAILGVCLVILVWLLSRPVQVPVSILSPLYAVNLQIGMTRSEVEEQISTLFQRENHYSQFIPVGQEKHAVYRDGLTRLVVRYQPAGISWWVLESPGQARHGHGSDAAVLAWTLLDDIP